MPAAKKQKVLVLSSSSEKGVKIPSRKMTISSSVPRSIPDGPTPMMLSHFAGVGNGYFQRTGDARP
jgi:hypothetical protein